MHSLSLLHLDDCLAAINKPSGLLVHRTPIDYRETTFAMQLLRDQLGRRVYPIHRLDKATSGVLVFALDQETARAMSQAFMNGAVSKSYLAVVRGVTKESGRIDHPVRGEGDAAAGISRDAVTEYRRLASIELPYPVGRYSTARFSLIKAIPLTGRTHQIRRHLKHIFHPVIGDTTYGDGKQNLFFRARFECNRLLLHAFEISFVHPRSGNRLHIRAPLDAVFGAVLERFDWSTAAAS